MYACNNNVSFLNLSDFLGLKDPYLDPYLAENKESIVYKKECYCFK